MILTIIGIILLVAGGVGFWDAKKRDRSENYDTMLQAFFSIVTGFIGIICLITEFLIYIF